MTNGACLKQIDSAETRDSVIVMEADGQIVHRFCTADEGAAMAAAIQDAGAICKVFTTPSIEAEMLITVSTLGKTVEDAKEDLRRAVAVRRVLEKHGVPSDPQIRNAVNAAVAELRLVDLRQAFSP